MTSARGVLSALVLTACLVGVARAQAPWPAGQPPVRSPDVVPEPPLAPPTIETQACVGTFAALRSQVEQTGMTVKRGSESRLGHDELCKLITAHVAAETKWVEFSEGNMSPCAIPRATIDQIKVAHATSADVLRRICGVEPNGRYRWDPPRRPNDYKSLPRFAGR